MTIEIVDTTVTLGEISENVIGTIDLGNVNITMAGIDPSTVYTKSETNTLLDGKQPKKLDTELYTNQDEKNAWNAKADVADIPTDFNNLYNTKSEITDFLADKQDKLISSVNLKTINNESLLGTGNIVIGGGGGTTDHAVLTNRNIADQHPMSAISGLDTALSNKEPLKGADNNYVTDNDIIKLSNLSGTNTGDQDLSGYSLTNHNHNLIDLAEKSYNSLDDLPTLFDGEYSHLANIPSTFAPSAHQQDIGTINGLETALNNKQTTIGYTTENIANKENSTISTDTTKYPTVNLLKTGLDLKENSIGAKKTAFNVDFGTSTGTACQGNDSRLSDSRTPLTHNQAETTIDFTDITTNDASITKHGFLPKLPNDSAKFLNGIGAWTNAGGGGETVNYEALTADKVLTATSATIQVLTCTADRTVTLPTTGLVIGQKFEIWNNNVYNSTYSITINPLASDKIYSQRKAIYRWNGTSWEYDNKDNVAIGSSSNGYSSGVAVGSNATGYSSGAAVGSSSNGYNYGAANGYQANGSSYGVANGYNANGYTYGVAVGSSSNGYNYGAAVGSSSNGYNYGAAVGSNATGSNYGVAVGSNATGYSSGVAIGRSSNGYSSGAAVGSNANGSNYGVANGSSANTNSKGTNTIAEGAYSKNERNREIVSTATASTTNKAQLTIQKYMEKNLATSAGAWQELFIDDTSARLTIIASSVYNFKAQINAIDVTTLDVKTWVITGTIKRNASNVTSLVDTPTKTVIGADTATTAWDAQITADDTNESLKIEVKHNSANNVRFSLNIFATETRV